MGRHTAVTSCILSCKHTAWFAPEPELHDVVYCRHCLNYRTVVVTSQIIVMDGLEINLHTKTVSLHDRAIYMNRLEYEVLEYLAVRRGKLISTDELLREIWKRSNGSRNATKLVLAQIYNVRSKLGDLDKHRYLHLVPGQGVRFGRAPAIVTSA